MRWCHRNDNPRFESRRGCTLSIRIESLHASQCPSTVKKTTICLLCTSIRWLIWQLAEGNIKYPEYEEIRRSLFSDHNVINLTRSRIVRTITLPPFSIEDSRKGKAGGIYRGKFLMHVEITSHVLLSQTSPKRSVTFLPMGPARFQSNKGPKRKLRVLSRAHINPKPLTWILNSIRAWQIPRGFSQGAKTTSEAIPPSDTKTLRSLLLLLWLQLGEMTPVIYGFDHAVRSSPCSKYYNAPTSMWAIMDSGEYLYMTIHVIKWCNSCSYEKFVTCKSSNYGDLTYPPPQQQTW